MTPCKEWTGYRTPKGYGRKQHEGRSMEAHRYVWMITFGPIPDGMHILHTCDNRACVEPSHLRLGTHQDNVADMIAKGRQARGEMKASAKLTADMVRSIRERVAGGVSRSAIARELGLSHSTVSRIVSRQMWGHV